MSSNTNRLRAPMPPTENCRLCDLTTSGIICRVLLTCHVQLWVYESLHQLLVRLCVWLIQITAPWLVVASLPWFHSDVSFHSSGDIAICRIDNCWLLLEATRWCSHRERLWLLSNLSSDHIVDRARLAIVWGALEGCQWVICLSLWDVWSTRHGTIRSLISWVDLFLSQ